MRTSIVLAMGILMTVWACDDRTALPCHEMLPNKPFEAKVHETWCLADESLKITFGPILEDSRCNNPLWDCVWAGRTVLELQIETNEAGLYKDTLFAERNWQDTLTIGSYALALTLVLPLERSDFNVDTAKYRFQMVLQ